MEKLNKYTNVKNEMLDDTIVVDLAAIPEGWNLDQWFNIAKTHGVMIVDSTKGGQMPSMIYKRRKLKYEIHDTSKKGEFKEDI